MTGSFEAELRQPRAVHQLQVKQEKVVFTSFIGTNVLALLSSQPRAVYLLQVNVLSLLALLVQKYLPYSRAEPRAVHQLLAE